VVRSVDGFSPHTVLSKHAALEGCYGDDDRAKTFSRFYLFAVASGQRAKNGTSFSESTRREKYGGARPRVA